MRIARVLTRLNLGGPARQVLASDPLLLDRGHEVTVFAGSPERAFVSCSQVNQVQVFDPTAPLSAPTTVTLAGEDAPPELWGALYQVDALKAFNRALAETAEEEHS